MPPFSQMQFAETVREYVSGTDAMLRFIWSARGLHKVEHVGLQTSPAPATEVQGELGGRFAALRLLLNGGRFTSEMVPLSLSGTDFQRAVWDQIALIPSGETITYRELAARAGRPEAIRAAASACGANPVPLVIPCHRVIASDGGLGGFIWGVDFKRGLLAREQAALHPLAA